MATQAKAEIVPTTITLPPCGATVVSLAELQNSPEIAPVRALLLRDPGALIAVLREAGPHHDSRGIALRNVWQSLPPLRTILTDWKSRFTNTFADWTGREHQLSYRVSVTACRLAHAIARAANIAADRAEIAAAVAPAAVHLFDTQRGRLTAAERGRLLRHFARTAGLPQWLANALLGLDLTPDIAADLSADPKLVVVVQAALAAAQQILDCELLTIPKPVSELLESLNVSDEALLQELEQISGEGSIALPAVMGETVAPLIWRSLALAAPSAEAVAVEQLAQATAEAEKLRRHLSRQRQTEEERLRDMKLRSVAELAAGAGHEINNPLAVISGQSQHLLRSEEAPERIRALERIVAQSFRIHHILKDLMFYARPPQPKLKSVRLKKIVGEALAGQVELANDRCVMLEERCARDKTRIAVDGGLVQIALSALLRNAVEAAPRNGWVRVSIDASAAGSVAVVVEDNGAGLSAGQREHLFDPFFSGRSAGRGLGMGLCKAWRIAQLHGGSVRFTSVLGQPTRFELRLPTGTVSPIPVVLMPAGVSGNGFHHSSRN